MRGYQKGTQTRKDFEHLDTELLQDSAIWMLWHLKFAEEKVLDKISKRLTILTWHSLVSQQKKILGTIAHNPLKKYIYRVYIQTLNGLQNKCGEVMPTLITWYPHFLILSQILVPLCRTPTSLNGTHEVTQKGRFSDYMVLLKLLENIVLKLYYINSLETKILFGTS